MFIHPKTLFASHDQGFFAQNFRFLFQLCFFVPVVMLL